MTVTSQPTEKQFEQLAHTIIIHTNPWFEKRVHETLNQIKAMIQFTVEENHEGQWDLFDK